MHTSSYRLSNHIHRDAGSGAMSSEVRISYFDPKTGKPLSEKPPKTRNLAESTKKGKRGRPGNPVKVDGKVCPSVLDAARVIGCSHAAIIGALAKGNKTVKGHTVERMSIAKG